MSTASPSVGERRTAFAALAREHEAALVGAGRRLCRGDDDRAMDLVQDTLVRAYQAYTAGRYQEENSARAWLLRILTNIFINNYRRRVRWESGIDLEHLAADSAPAPAALLAADDDTPAARLFKRTLDEDLERALNSLPDILRVCIVLVDIEGLEYAEAAKALGVPVGTIRSRLARGRMQLHDRLQDYARRRGLLKNQCAGDKS